MRTPERQPGHVRRTRSAWQRGTSLALAAAFLVASCSDDGGATPTTTPTTTEATGGSTTSTTAPGGDGTGADGNGSNGDGTGNGSLVSPSSLRLSEGHAQTAPADPTPVVDGTPLDDDAIAAVLDRLPEWVAEESLAELFAWPTQTLPAPIAGNTLHDQFPPADTAPPPDVPTGPLHVLRHQPDGDVALAPFISITFDQPMVPVTTIGQLAGEDVPATITPALPGRWQWIGTRTLRFDYDANAGGLDRLPMATSYTVEVPAGATSATGGSLADGVSWTFTTPPVTVQSFVPSPDVAIDLTPVFVATFDQRVDPDAVLAVTTSRPTTRRRRCASRPRPRSKPTRRRTRRRARGRTVGGSRSDLSSRSHRTAIWTSPSAPTPRRPRDR